MLGKSKLESKLIRSDNGLKKRFQRWYVKKVISEKASIPVLIQQTDYKFKETGSSNKARKVTNDDNFRVNELNIQMLSRSLYEQLFGKVKHQYPKNKEMIRKALQELKKHGLPGTLQKVPDVNLSLPELHNGNIEDHFYFLGQQQSQPYKILVDKFLNGIPAFPKKWNFSPGWTKYVDEKCIPVDYPQEDSLIFDVEICCTRGETPVMATAVSPTCWYSWVSKDLCSKEKIINKKTIYDYSTDELIPLETPPHTQGGSLDRNFFKPRVVIGHNVSFDRARIKEQYWLDRTELRFIDTMSLHIAISGISSYQKLLLKTETAQNENWSEFTSVNNSLSEIHKFYCGEELKKEERNVFVTGTLEDIKNDFQNLMAYCARDVQATYQILSHLWPLFLERFPHPVTLAGMLELSNTYLPVNKNWRRYTESAQQTYDDMNVEAQLMLSQQVDKCCQLLHEEKFKSNIWIWDADWKLKILKLNKAKVLTKKQLKEQEKIPVPSKLKQTCTNEETEDFDRGKLEKLEKRFSDLLNTKNRLPVRIPYLAGYPEWYRKICCSPNKVDWEPGPQLVSTSMKVVPKVLSLTWNFMPLHHVRKFGWCYIVPYKTNISFPAEELAKFPLRDFILYYLRMNEQGHVNDENVNIEDLKSFLNNSNPNSQQINIGLVKLPHKNGDDLNVGNPMAKDFIDKFTDLKVTGGNPYTTKMIEINQQISYWKNNCDRIKNQFVVWLKDKDFPPNLRSQDYGVILPCIVVCGTLTRRSVERTWMTAANALDEKIGSELRSMIQAPPNYSIIGADVDSQELWISSLIGDSNFAKEHGCTAFGWMTLSGQKADKTDMHSVTAKTMGISRNDAKVVNYARIYGAGEKFASRLLKQLVPTIMEAEASSVAKKMIQTTKGQRLYELKKNVLPEQSQRNFYLGSAKKLCQMYNKNIDELFKPPKWVNGSESFMFNSLEEIASHKEPKTPFLGSRLSKALEPAADKNNKFTPTRINWVVQSSAVDFLHLMLVSMRSLIDPRIRFCLSFHDEVRYLVPDDIKYETALALHVTNLLARSFFVQRLGMCDLPQSVAFFSSVEVDKVLRKDCNHNCITPSNPHGLSKGYGIPPGESLDIVEAIHKAKGKIGNYTPKNGNV